MSRKPAIIISIFTSLVLLCTSSPLTAGQQQGPPPSVDDPMGGQKPVLEISMKEGHQPTFSNGNIKLEVVGNGLLKNTRFMVSILFEGEYIEGQRFEFKSDKLLEKVELKLKGRGKFFAGTYILQAVFDPGQQKKKLEEKLLKKLGKDRCRKCTAYGQVVVGDDKASEMDRKMLVEHYKAGIEETDKLNDEFLKKFHEIYKETTGTDTSGKEIDGIKKKEFRPAEWRKFLDSWRAKLGRLNDKHERMQKQYIAMRWPKCHEWFSKMIGALNYLSKMASIRLYKANKLDADPEDIEPKGNIPSDPGSHTKNFEFNKKRIVNFINARETSKAIKDEAKKKKKELEKEDKKKKSK
ncbi:MAG: hypothetical protein ACYS8W_07925 [Planctomycetota bacterium]|jgi:hypothetical protein